MTVRVIESWDAITIKPGEPATKAIVFRLSCGCIASVTNNLLLAVASRQTIERAFSQLAELHQCPVSGPSPKPEPKDSFKPIDLQKARYFPEDEEG